MAMSDLLCLVLIAALTAASHSAVTGCIRHRGHAAAILWEVIQARMRPRPRREKKA